MTPYSWECHGWRLAAIFWTAVTILDAATGNWSELAEDAVLAAALWHLDQYTRRLWRIRSHTGVEDIDLVNNEPRIRISQ